MKGITIRFADDAYDMLKEEAARAGIGLTAYVREAALSRAVITRARRGHFAGNPQLHAAIREWLEAERQLRREPE